MQELGSLVAHTFKPIKKIEGKEGAIDVVTGIKAYETYEDMAADKDNNVKMLSSFDAAYWTIDNGIPYWKQVYENMVKVIAKDADGNEVTDFTLDDVNDSISIELEVGTTKLNTNITAGTNMYFSKCSDFK